MLVFVCPVDRFAEKKHCIHTQWKDSWESLPTPQFKRISSSVLSFLYVSTLTSIHDSWNNHNSDYTYYSYCSWGSQGNSTEVVCHSLLQWPTFCQTSPPWPAHLGWPHTAWLSFIELGKAVVYVIRLTSFLWLWFVCLPYDASHNTHRLSWVSLTLDVGYLFTAVPAKRICCS